MFTSFNLSAKLELVRCFLLPAVVPVSLAGHFQVTSMGKLKKKQFNTRLTSTEGVWSKNTVFWGAFTAVSIICVFWDFEPCSSSTVQSPRRYIYNGQRAFENRLLRRIFGPKRDEVTGGSGENCNTRSLMICNPRKV
jgi:hypothetical protein